MTSFFQCNYFSLIKLWHKMNCYRWVNTPLIRYFLRREITILQYLPVLPVGLLHVIMVACVILLSLRTKHQTEYNKLILNSGAWDTLEEGYPSTKNHRYHFTSRVVILSIHHAWVWKEIVYNNRNYGEFRIVEVDVKKLKSSIWIMVLGDEFFSLLQIENGKFNPKQRIDEILCEA